MSDKSAASPGHTGNVQQRATGNPSGGSKENSADVKPGPASMAEESSKTPTRLTPSQIKNERDDDAEASNMPTIMEEGPEPPQSDVLPT